MAATLPLEDMQGEVTVQHRCDHGCSPDDDDGGDFYWTEAAKEPLRVIAAALETQAALARAIDSLRSGAS